MEYYLGKPLAMVFEVIVCCALSAFVTAMFANALYPVVFVNILGYEPITGNTVILLWSVFLLFAMRSAKNGVENK